ncbi:MAG: HAMP domain-containing sensor histidine kinase [Acidobacteriaceae bacterium]|nr:HAMP domain-containing sensor histidine kinase [Acidobacteriaceae bacterium]
MSNRAARPIRSIRPPSAPTAAASSHGVSEWEGLAHDAGNLLGALGLYAELLTLPGILAPECRSYAEELRMLAERSTALVGRLLTNAGMATGVGITTDTPSGDAIRCLTSLQPVLQRMTAQDAAFQLILPSTLPELPFPAEVLERIVLNLVRNAATALHKASTPDGRIDVSLSVVAHRLVLVVADNGPGMAPATAALFLSPARSGESSVCGLGHRIIHDLAHRTGAGIDLRVLPGNGTRFEVSWPLHASSQGADRQC